MKRKILKQDEGGKPHIENGNTPQTPSSPKWLNTFG
jgi:hypothetical protein